MSYREVAGDLNLKRSRGSYDKFREGCRLLHRQNVSIPQLLSQIAFSTVHIGNTKYISGMRLISSAGAVIESGYWSGKKVYSANITSLKGLHVAVGSRGIQAIQVIGDKQHTSQWLGSPKECPKTLYLAVSKPIKTMKAGYDVSDIQAPCVLITTDALDSQKPRDAKWSALESDMKIYLLLIGR